MRKVNIELRRVRISVPISLLLACASSFAVSSVKGQEAPPPPQAPAPEEPKEISTAEFAIEASAVEDRLKRVRTQIALIDVLEDVKAQLEDISAQGAALSDKLERASTRRAMSSELNSLRFQVEALETRSEVQVARLSEYAGALVELSKQNDEDIEAWGRALQQGRKPSVPKAVRDRTASILQGLREGRKELQRAVGEVLELQTHALDVSDAIRIAEQKLELAQQEQAKGIFEPQFPPLWQPTTELEKAAASPSDALGFSWSEIRSYSSDKRGALPIFLLFVLLAAWLLVWARKTIRARIETHGEAASTLWEQQAAEALQHPWAAALLLGVAAWRIVEPDRTVETVVLVWTVSLPLWFIVYKAMVPEAFLKALVGLGLLGALHVVVTVISSGSRLGRIPLLLELALAFAGSIWLIRFLRGVDVPKRVREGLWFSATSLWARFALLASLLGFGAAALGYAYLGTEAALVTIVGTIAGTAWMSLARIVESVISIAVHAGKLDALRMIRANRDLTAKTLSRLTRLLATGLFIWSLAEMTSAWRPAQRVLEAALSADLGLGFTKLGLSVGDLVGFFLVLWLSWLLSRFVSFVLGEEVFPRLQMKGGVPYALTTFTRYAIIAIGFIAAISVMGVPLDRLTVILSALGVGIGFGLQKFVSNVVSGFVLLTERQLRLHDVVQMDTMFGKVSHIGIRSSIIRTFDGAEVITPNDDLIGAKVVNWTLSDLERRITMPVGVAYGTDPNQVLGILRRLAAEHERVLKSPPPVALFRGFGESSLDFELRYFVDASDILEVPSKLHVAVTEAFAEAGIEIPFPQRDLHVRSVVEGLIPADTGAQPRRDEVVSREGTEE